MHPASPEYQGLLFRLQLLYIGMRVLSCEEAVGRKNELVDRELQIPSLLRGVGLRKWEAGPVIERLKLWYGYRYAIQIFTQMAASASPPPSLFGHLYHKDTSRRVEMKNAPFSHFSMTLKFHWV